jgi:hypothetical protein
MGQRDFAFLDALAKTLVCNLPIVATVSYNRHKARLTVDLRSLADPSGIRKALAHRWSPQVHDYADLEQ